jgi:hypothetical protein
MRRSNEVDLSWGEVQKPARDIVTVTISNGVRLPVHRDVAAMAKYLLESALVGGYRTFHAGNTWGLSVRPVRGVDDLWSAHSYGTAIDVASDLNPMARPLRTDMPAWLPALFEAWGWRWGGRWTKRPDPMHYSFAGTRDRARILNAQAAVLVAAQRWGLGPDAKPFTPPAGTTPAPTPHIEEDLTVKFWLLQEEGDPKVYIVRGDFTGGAKHIPNPARLADIRTLVGESGSKLEILNGGEPRVVGHHFMEFVKAG